MGAAQDTGDSTAPGARFDDRFVRALPGDASGDRRSRAVFGAAYSRVAPTPVRAPRLLALAEEVAALLELAPTALATPEWVDTLAGNRLQPGMVPYAAAYGGHQFGHWAGQLGDGRAITLGERLTSDGRRYELQLKGAGPTPYSRHSDGRAVLRSSLREFVASEAMFHLGVPTTRALSLVATGEEVLRDLMYDGNPRYEPGAVVCRVAPSFVRFGNFELPASRGDEPLLEALFADTLAQHFPELGAPSPESALAWLEEVGRRSLALAMHWTRVGFVHGVLNTDNLSVLGLTLDYGPFGWLEPFEPRWTPNTTDAAGRRYAFGGQPRVVLWNTARLAEAMFPLIGDEEPLQDLLTRLDAHREALTLAMWREKLGLSALDPEEGPGDAALAGDLLKRLEATRQDYTLTFRAFADLSTEVPAERQLDPLRDAAYTPWSPAEEEAWVGWLTRYFARIQRDPRADHRKERMNATNPLYVARNALLFEAITAAEAGDTGPLDRLVHVLKRPYEPQDGAEPYAKKRPTWAEEKPGCSMLSCSS